jgi:hypothetical protein
MLFMVVVGQKQGVAGLPGINATRRHGSEEI